MNKPFLILAAGVPVLALAAGFFAGRISGTAPGAEKAAAAEESEILYWVAPMDPNYRRDAPGKSPMGMDLVPVYAGDAKAQEDEPALRIDPAVVNMLGVRTAPVTRGPLLLDVETVGFVSPDEEKLSDINLRSEGWVEELAVRAAGERVEKGQLLFKLYSPGLVAAQREYLQARKLGGKGLTEAAWERLIALGMDARQIAGIERDGKAKRLVGIYAPQSGTVLALKVREGMFVQPSDRTMRIADLSSVWIMADIFETAIGRIAEGQHAAITLPAFPGDTWEGEVDYVYPTADPRTRTVPVRLRLKNPERRLRPAMFANVRIRSEAAEDALTVPASAIIRQGTQERAVLSLGSGRFRPAAITAGLEANDRVQIMNGLQEGEEVVTSAHFLIDSEASLEPGLLRLASDKMEAGEEMTGDMPGGDAAYEAMATIQSLDPAERRITLDHEPVPGLGWPAMIMGFSVADGIPLDGLKPGMRVHFTFRKIETGYEATAIHPMKSGTGPEDME
ncbi:efflux RND transporter periplasmic adaptor subunit [Tepidicaulis sp.]|uniref:efflux RND transporter periplasmic adaptor subunit n=1 Tax=Tepidicaulis sp. TaxID=1920809 RepID=UPI000EF89364